MNSPSDQQLLKDYAGQRSETAFAELVRRHIDLVYSAALRMVCDTHLAKDVTQGVFVALAQNAGQLMERPVLSGWLHRTAQNLAANSVRSDVRRRGREQEAATMNELLSSGPDASWEDIAPLLDSALSELSESDRDAVLLRYFERKSAPEMAQMLNISNEAAQKRVNRAVERLRDYFSKRNVAIGVSSLVVVISANAVAAAPEGLAAVISGAGILAGGIAHTSTIMVATKAVSTTLLSKAIITAALAAVVGAGIYEARQAGQLREQNEKLQQQQAPLVEQVRQLQTAQNEASNRLARLADELSTANSNNLELLKLRAEVTRLQQDAQELAQLKSDSGKKGTDMGWLDRVGRLRQRLEETPGAKIPELQFLTELDWLYAAQHPLETDDDYLKAFAELRARGEGHFLDLADTALRKYLGDHQGRFPTDLAELESHFDDSSAAEILTQRYKIVPASSMPQANTSGNQGDWLITLKVQDSGSQWAVGINGVGGSSAEDSDALTILAPAIQAAMKATPQINGKKNVSIENIKPYLTTPEQEAAYQKLMQRSHPNSQ